MPPVEPLIVFCNPGDRRSEGIQQARSRLGMPPAVLIPYAGLLQGQPLADLLEQTGYRLDMLPVREQPLGGVSGQAGQRVDAMQVLDALQGQAKVNSPAPDRLPELTELAAQGRDISRLAMPAASAPAAPAPDTAPPAAAAGVAGRQLRNRARPDRARCTGCARRRRLAASLRRPAGPPSAELQGGRRAQGYARRAASSVPVVPRLLPVSAGPDSA